MKNDEIFKNLTKRVWKVTQCLAIFMIMAGCKEEPSPSFKHSSQLVIGLSADYPPFEFQQNGTFVGLDVELMTLLAKELGMQASFQDMDFSGLIPALQSGRIMAAISGISATKERKKHVDFSEPYYNGILVMIMKTESTIKAIGDLAHKRIGVQLGSTMEQFAKQQEKLLPGISLVSLNRVPNLIEELKIGRIDVVIVDEIQAIEFKKRNPSLKYSSLPQTGLGYAIAFKKGSPLKTKVDAALEKLRQKGALKTLKQKWIGKE